MKVDRMLEVKRTLVKSSPELWAEVADPAAIARHLSPFGSVRITRAEPESLVEWEADLARGTVHLESSGFGTRVSLRADTRPIADAAEPSPRPDPEPEPEAGVEPAGEPARAEQPAGEPARPRFWARLFRRAGARPVAPVTVTSAPVAVTPAPEPPPPAPAPPEPLIDDESALAVLSETLEALGTAHHRPFSRS